MVELVYVLFQLNKEKPILEKKGAKLALARVINLSNKIIFKDVQERIMKKQLKGDNLNQYPDLLPGEKIIEEDRGKINYLFLKFLILRTRSSSSGSINIIDTS